MRCKTRPPSAPLAEAAVRFRCEKCVVATSDLSAVAQRAKAERGSDDAIQSSISPRRCRIWDHNDRKEGLNRKPGPLLRALDDSSAFCQHEVVAGDFNNNPLWDKPNGPNNMARISQELLERGLVSLYHHGTGLPFGGEAQGTYWQYRDQMKPYHIDYIFVPTAWLKNMVSFDIGSFDDWCAPGLSDHAPLSAEFNL